MLVCNKLFEIFTWVFLNWIFPIHRYNFLLWFAFKLCCILYNLTHGNVVIDQNGLWGVWQQQKLSLHVPLKFTVQLTLINLNETVVWVYSTVHTVLKRPWILGEVLENSLSFCASPWKVLEFSLTFNSVAWKVFLMLFFGCPRHNINHNSENLRVIYQGAN